MAARRLIAVLVVLLVVSSIAAALAPEARRVTTTTTTTGADTTSTEPTAPNSQPGPDTREPGEQKPAPAGDEIPAGILVERTISVEAGAGVEQDAKGSKSAQSAEPPAIEVSVGDRLALEVTAADTAEIEIPDFGLLETAAAGSPARFDLLLREPGSFPIRVVDGPTVGEISVTEPVEASSKPGAGDAS